MTAKRTPSSKATPKKAKASSSKAPAAAKATKASAAKASAAKANAAKPNALEPRVARRSVSPPATVAPVLVATSPARSRPAPQVPDDAVEVSGIYGRYLYSESDPDAEVREIFDHYDRTGSGRIAARQFARICEALGVELDEEELQAGLAVVDADGDGQIQWDEFVSWWRSTGS
jgi:calmodulin